MIRLGTTQAQLIIQSFGEFLFFLKEVLSNLFRKPWRWHNIVSQLYFIGNESIGIILLTGFFTGAVFGLQIGGIFAVFKSESLMGGATGLALAKELAALVTAFLLSGRAGSSMTAEIATMKVNEQIDAMEAMGVDPVHYLVVPRVLASVVMMPLLCGVFMLVGIIGAFCSGVFLFNIDQGIFIDKLVVLVSAADVFAGIRKMFFFSLIISIISCRFGLRAGGGAKGVGQATTDSVVTTLVCLLVVDFCISYIELRWFK